MAAAKTIALTIVVTTRTRPSAQNRLSTRRNQLMLRTRGSASVRPAGLARSV